MNAIAFQDSVRSFVDSITPSESAVSLRDKFSHAFPVDYPFSDKEEVKFLIDYVNQQITTEKAAKAFSLAIPSELVKKIYKDHTKANVNFSVLMRSYITLRHCHEKRLDAKGIVKRMQKEKITDERLRYKFAAFAAKKSVEDFTDEVTSFNIKDQSLIKRLAELALYFNAQAFFADLNEFNFLDLKVREEFYLKGLIRSVSVVENLLEDSVFTSSLEKIPSSILKILYEKFNFGSEIFQKAIQARSTKQTPHKKSVLDFFGIVDEERKSVSSKELVDPAKETAIAAIDAASLFALVIHNGSSPAYYQRLQAIGFREEINIFNDLSEPEQHALLAMILLIKSLDQPEKILQDPLVLTFLEEIHRFRDPFVRFAVVALALAGIEKSHELVDRLSHHAAQRMPSDAYPQMYSLVLFTCERLGIKEGFKLLNKKWKDINFRKHFVRFLAELCLSERLNFQEKAELLSRLFTHKDWQTAETLADLTLCLSHRLGKRLLEGETPSSILLDRQYSFIRLLGEPYSLFLSPQLFAKLEYRKEISYYAQALEKLSGDEKRQMVHAFFHFLQLSAEGKMQEERFNTDELTLLFATHKLNEKIWQEGSESTVSQLFTDYGIKIDAFNAHEPFNIRNALQRAFDESHLEEFPELPDLFNNTTHSFKLDGPTIGRCIKDEKKKEVVLHLFSCLLEEQNLGRQKELINHLTKFFPKGDFLIDLKNWAKAINFQLAPKIGYENYKIIRSGDPYLLFRIGSIAGESCQRVTGDPAKNKCLLAYPCDGKNEVICTIDENNKIQARAILRFFYACNPQEKIDNRAGYTELFPVLYLEPFYPAGTVPVLRAAMTLSAIECAKKLQVQLVRHYKIEEKTHEERGYGHTLQTINGPAPFEYYDGINPKIKTNDFSEEGGYGSTSVSWIEGANVKLLFDPSDPLRFEI